MKVVVVPHDPSWSGRYEVESGRIARALGPNAVAVHHIGSTAIPNIYAKPIIDMLVEVGDIDQVGARNPAMEALGYEAMGEFGIEGRRYFRKDNEAGIRTHQAHIFMCGSPQIERHLDFRDFLLEHPEWAERYSELKRRLAKVHSDDIEGYMDGKDPFIKEVGRRAATWRKL